jgi:uncharacterized phiE125 gp8 family phage protein
MALNLIAGPLVRPFTLDEVKAHLRVENDDDDLLILSMMDAAVAHLDGRDGWLGRALVEQTWELALDRFPLCIELPLPPLISVDSITYIDVNGDTVTIDPDKYQVVVEGFRKAMVVPAYRLVWPVPRDVRQAVRVTFTAGYATVSPDSPIELTGTVPANLVTALKFHVEMLYGRDPKAAATLQATIDALAVPFRIGGAG